VKHRIFAAAVGLCATVAFSPAVSAKTLVYCSEGSPEGFNPSLYTSGTTFDASSRQLFNPVSYTHLTLPTIYSV